MAMNCDAWVPHCARDCSKPFTLINLILEQPSRKPRHRKVSDSPVSRSCVVELVQKSVWSVLELMLLAIMFQCLSRFGGRGDFQNTMGQHSHHFWQVVIQDSLEQFHYILGSSTIEIESLHLYSVLYSLLSSKYCSSKGFVCLIGFVFFCFFLFSIFNILQS